MQGKNYDAVGIVLFVGAEEGFLLVQGYVSATDPAVGLRWPRFRESRLQTQHRRLPGVVGGVRWRCCGRRFTRVHTGRSWCKYLGGSMIFWNNCQGSLNVSGLCPISSFRSWLVAGVENCDSAICLENSFCKNGAFFILKL